MGRYYWPPGVQREQTLEAFFAAFQTKGYERCDDSSLEIGFEKLAIYATPDGTPTHAARQLPNGKWTSKLGDLEDIEHDALESISGPEYGSAVAYMVRKSRLI